MTFLDPFSCMNSHSPQTSGLTITDTPNETYSDTDYITGTGTA